LLHLSLDIVAILPVTIVAIDFLSISSRLCDCLWRFLSFGMSLVLTAAPVIFEPVDQSLEWSVTLVVEVEALGSHFDELLYDLVTWNIGEYDVLWIHRQDGESIWNALRLLLLLFLDTFLQLLKGLSIQELGMTSDLTDESVDRDDVALDDFTQVVELIVADQKTFAYRSTLSLVLLDDVDMNEVLLEELPSQRDAVFTASRWSEDIVTDLSVLQFSQSSS